MLARKTLPALFSALVLATAPVLAQEDQKQTKPQDPPQPAITLTTTDVMAGTAFLGRFDPEGELPDITEKQFYKLALTSDGKVKATVEDGAAGFLNAKITVPGVMKLFEKQIDDNWELVSDSMIVGLTQMGFSTKDAAKLMKAMRAFPAQVATLEVNLSGHPQNELKGLVIDVRVKPTAGSWLAKAQKALRPHAQGAPIIPVGTQNRKPLMTASIAVAEEGWDVVLGPMLDTFAAFGAKTKKQRESNRELIDKMMGTFGGAFGAAGDPFGVEGFNAIGTVLDPKAYAKLVASDSYQKYMQLFEKMSPMVETEFTAVDFEYKGIKVAKTIITTEIDTPGRPAGDQIQYAGVAGNYMLTSTGSGKKGMQKLIDVALGNGIKRKPLPNGLLGVMEFQFMRLLDAASPFGNPLDGEENVPDVMRLEFDTKGGTFHAALKFK